MARDTKLNPNRSKSREQLIQELDEKLRLNRGSFSNQANEVGSNAPFLIQQGRRVENPTGLGYQNPQLNFDIPQAPSIPQVPEAYSFTPQEFGGEVMGASNQLSENPSPREVLQAIFNAAWEPQLPTIEQLDAVYQQTGIPYSVANNRDGTVRMNDGTVQKQAASPPKPHASMADGTILWTDGFLRERPPEGLGSYLAGVAGLSQFIFGKEQTVTQEYGNVNPGMGYANNTHRGTDFRTRDLEARDQFAPVPMRVIDVIRAESGSPYGNSIFLELPGGAGMVRFSHFGDIGQLQPGDVLNPGDRIGSWGSTGNSTGEHLDVEFYTADGQLTDPREFRLDLGGYNIGNKIVGISPYGMPIDQSVEEDPFQSTQQSQQPQPQQQMPTPVTDAITGAVEGVKSGVQAAQQLPGQVGSKVASTIQSANPTGEYGLGLSYGLQGEGEKARQQQNKTLEAIGTITGAPELQTSELSDEQKTNPFRQLAGNLVDVATTPLKKFGMPDTGMSEAIAGGKTVNTDVNLAPQSFATDSIGNKIASKAPTPQDYAGVLGKNVSDVKDYAKSGLGNIFNQAKQTVSDTAKQAGEGIKSLTQGSIDKASNIFQKTPLAKIGESRAVGEESPGGEQQGIFNQNSLLDAKAFGAKNDTRDEFFKQGGSETFNTFLKPNAQDQFGGALSLDLFNNDFFKDFGNITSVFGGSKDIGKATDKFTQFEKEKYPTMSRMNWEEGYDRGEVDKYNRQIDDYNNSVNRYLDSIRTSANQSQSIYQPSLKGNVFSKPNMSMGMSASNPTVMSKPQAPQMSQNRPQAPQMSMARPSAPQMSMPRPAAPQMSMARPAAPQMSMARPSTPQMSVAPRPSVSAPQMSVRPGSSAPQMSVAPKPQMSMAPKSTPQMSVAPRMSVAPKAQPAPQKNIFSRAVSSIKNIFGR